MACLVILNGENEGKYYQLTKRPLAGGRDPATEIQIIDPKASRRHFQVRQGDDGYVVRELNSKNGVSSSEQVASSVADSQTDH